MGVHTHGSTLQGAVTPICNDCGVALCWDIAIEEYEEDKGFWDRWICRDCNGGTPLSRRTADQPKAPVKGEPL